MKTALKHDFRPAPEAPSRPATEPPAEFATAPTPAGKKRRIWPWIVLLLLTGGGAAAYFAPRLLAPKVPEASLPPVKRQHVSALGYLEPASRIIKLAAPATVEQSRLATLSVTEGDQIEAGQVVATLDTADKIRAQINTAQAQVDLKRVQVLRAKIETENSVALKKLGIDRAAAELAQAEAEFDRQNGLVKQQFGTAANLEKRRRDLDVARAQLAEARKAQERLQVLVDNQPVDVAVVQREVAAAEAELAYQKVLLDQSAIRSPINGRVIAIHTRPGEKISADGVLEVASTDRMVAIAEVYQSDIALIYKGQPVALISDNFATEVTGTVERIALEVKRQSVINSNPATDTDARVIEIRIALDEATSAAVASLTNLQVRANFKLGAQP